MHRTSQSISRAITASYGVWLACFLGGCSDDSGVTGSPASRVDAAFSSFRGASSDHALFASLNDKGQRVSLNLTPTTVSLSEAGDISYEAKWLPGQPNPLNLLYNGQDILMEAVRGKHLKARSSTARLRLAFSGRETMERMDSRGLSVPIELVGEQGSLEIKAQLSQEPSGYEFSVASYNVENLFDQKDEDRNADYGDYRIAANHSGQSSNYGTPVEFEGQMISMTEVKARHIRETLLLTAPGGPEVVGLVEVESNAALAVLKDMTKDLGYQYSQFTDWPGDMDKPAVGMAVLSKFPIKEWSLIAPSFEQDDGETAATVESLGALKPRAFTFADSRSRRNSAPRPILKVRIDVHGHDLYVYVNHWKSKSGPESMRMAYARALQDDLSQLETQSYRPDYVLLGDFNSDYDESSHLKAEHNDTNGTTGINHVLSAQGDEVAVAHHQNSDLKYNLHYDLPRPMRRTAWHKGFGWSSLDHMIIGPGMYDQLGITYIDGTFEIPRQDMPQASKLFTSNGRTKRWEIHREGAYTRHGISGYSDHLPIYARFRVSPKQSQEIIPLYQPSRSN